jgi:hypothetical protein
MSGKWIVGQAVAVVFLAAASASAQEAQVREAVAKASDWNSYKMICEDTVEEKVVGGGSKSNTDPSEVLFEKDKGLWTKAGKNESILIDGKNVVKGKDGAWAVKPPKKQKAQNPGDPPPAAPAVLPPHQSLRGLEKSSAATSSEDGGNDVYSITLQLEGAVSLLGDLIKNASKAAAEPACTAKLHVNKEGVIVKLEVECSFSTKSSKSGEEKNYTIKRVVTFKDVNSTTLEVPEEVKKALEAK